MNDLVTPHRFIAFLKELEAEINEDIKAEEMLSEEQSDELDLTELMSEDT